MITVNIFVFFKYLCIMKNIRNTYKKIVVEELVKTFLLHSVAPVMLSYIDYFQLKFSVVTRENFFSADKLSQHYTFGAF